MSPQLTRKCPACGQLNPADAACCGSAACGADLSAVRPAFAKAEAGEERAATAGAASRLILVIGDQSFECRDGDVLGREGSVASQVFASLGTVSRQHVRFTVVGGRWFITVPSQVQNLTQLDGRDLKRGEPCPLNGEHVLRMSTKCEVRLRVMPD